MGSRGAIAGVIEMLECKRCGNKWEPRIKKSPKQCPKCKSPYWNQKRLSREQIEVILKERVKNGIIHDPDVRQLIKDELKQYFKDNIKSIVEMVKMKNGSK
jgi:primosomal protein N'